MVNVHGGPIERVKVILHTYLLWYFEIESYCFGVELICVQLLVV